MTTRPLSAGRLLKWAGIGFVLALFLPTLIGMGLHLVGFGPVSAHADAPPEQVVEVDSEGVEPVQGVPESEDVPALGSPASADVPEAAEESAVGAVEAETGAGAAEEVPAEVDAPAQIAADVEQAAEGTAEESEAEAEAAAAAATADAGSAALRLGPGDVRPIQRFYSFLGIFGFLGIAFLLSNNRRRIAWRTVVVGVSIQIGFALFILKTPLGQPIFEAASAGFVRLLAFTNEGNIFLFGSYALSNEIHPGLINFVFAVLPTIIFFSSLMTVLYYLGVMQKVVAVVARVMQKTMGTAGSETTSAAANIFVGQTEAPLMVKPFVATMTMSELMAVMTAGFATVAGGVLALYVQFLSPFFPGIAGHLMAASVMAAPGALVIAKIMFPETEESDTKGEIRIELERTDANVIDAAARGASEGLMLALNVAAMLLAFIALIALIDFVVGVPSFIQHGFQLRGLLESVGAGVAQLPADLLARCNVLDPEVSVGFEERATCVADIAAAAGVEAPSLWFRLALEDIFGVAFFPFAFLMGAPLSDCFLLGQLLGQKMVVNELYAYLNLSIFLQDPDITLSPRTIILATYALCGFANFASIAIQIGGIGTIAPSRRSDLARLGFRAMIAGSLASFLNATIAGMIL